MPPPRIGLAPDCIVAVRGSAGCGLAVTGVDNSGIILHAASPDPQLRYFDLSLAPHDTTQP
jgi:hypothetical protein